MKLAGGPGRSLIIGAVGAVVVIVVVLLAMNGGDRSVQPAKEKVAANPAKPPEVAGLQLTAVLNFKECARCRARGKLLDGVIVVCSECLGIGRVIRPAKDLQKVLPPR